MIALAQFPLQEWLVHYFLVFARVGGMLMVMPVIGTRAVPVRARLLLAVALTLLAAPLAGLPSPQADALPAQPLSAPAGFSVLMDVARELLLGALGGFILLLAFEAVLLGGELIASSMGLGFAQMVDPLRGVSTQALGSFLSVFATLLFIALGGHLLAIELLLQSFASQPVGGGGLAAGVDPMTLIGFGTQVFRGGLMLALPIVIALLMVNLAMGVVSRSAPALNLFAVGFPVTLIAGLLLLRAGLPAFAEQLTTLFDSAVQLVSALFGVTAQ